ncbi:MAG: substrate-binding domain-containing protein [Isosphaeraceae bacterium]|nr:substrate-binding domain-containing protein [Isosphaeraceae bacterium]
MASPRRVAVLIDSWSDYSNHVVKGIVRYVREHTPWLLLVQSRDAREQSTVPGHWRPQGVIARVTYRALAQRLRRLGVPVVNVSRSTVPEYDFPQVALDERAVGHLAAEHLLQQGLRQFAYCGLPSQANYNDTCGPAFADRLAREGRPCHVFQPPLSAKPPHAGVTIANLQRWLRRLPKPIGVLGLDPERAYELSEACWASEIQVPDEVAIIAGEDDELLCAISHPPLSCIDTGPERVGYEAAARLDRLMEGSSDPGQPQYVPPLGVIARHSTDTLAIDDADVVRAVRFIRQNAFTPIAVSDVLREVPLSRRALEQRFRALLGRSPAAEIRRLRIERAKELLARTDWAIPRVAAAAGFSYTEVMNQVFRRELNLTPTLYRRGARAGEL